MKYMIMLFGGLGDSDPPRTPEWFKELGVLMGTLDGELRDAGEWVAGEGLADPTQATTVRFADGALVATDGPYPEIKESLAGYWVIEASRERAVEIVSRVVAFTERPMEIRQVMEHQPPP